MSRSRPFLIIQLRPEDETADSEFAAILRYGHLHADEVRRERVERNGLPVIDLNDYAGIIVGGSPFDVSTPQQEKSAIQLKVEEGFRELLGRVVAEDFPFLGACSGNGLLGSFCGASISRRYGEPVGGVDVSVTEAGRSDPLLEGLPDSFRALVGHKEACDDTPPGATLLVRGETCPVQMFRVGRNVYATQFHPEGDVDEFCLRIDIYKNHGYFPVETAGELKSAVSCEWAPVPNEILRRFVERYRCQ